MPVLPRETVIRPSRTSRWRAAVLVGIHLLIAAHLAHWLWAGATLTPLEPSEAMELGRRGVVNAGLIFFAAAVVVTAIFGRFFCGWACHLVALQDLCRWGLARIGIRPVALRSRWLAWVPSIAFFYVFCWPWVYRIVTRQPYDGLHFDLVTSDFWATFPGFFVGALTFVVCGFLVVYLLGAKGFCTYACPYGALFAAVDRFAPWRIRVTDACEGCGHCTAVCTSNVRVHEEVARFGMVADKGCMKCLDCVSVCPNDALYWGKGKPAGRAASAERSLGPKWLSAREELVLVVAFVVAFFILRGLYDLLPFLFSLGAAACVAYLVLQTWWMLERPNVRFRNLQLERQGKLTTAGRLFAVAMVALSLFLGHSAVVRYEQFRGDRAFRSVASLRGEAIALSGEPLAVTSAQLAALDGGIGALSRVRDWGLVAAPGSLRQLAWLQLIRGQDAEAAAAAARRAGAPAAEMLLVEGHQRLRNGDPSGAIDSWEQALREGPVLSDVALALGMVRAGRGELAAAEAAFRLGIAESGPSPSLFYNLALARAIQGDSVEAIGLFEKALDLAPADLAARENLAGTLASVGRFDEAAAHYREALDLEPGDASTRILLAQVLAAQGRIDAARSELEKSLEIEADNPVARSLLDSLPDGKR